MGELAPLSNLKMVKNGILISSFDNKEVFNLHNTRQIPSSDFQISYSTDKIEATTLKEYNNVFNTFHNALKNEVFDKIVLSKIKSIPTEKSALGIFEKLCKNYPNAFCYLFSSAKLGCWIGATPELLCQTKENSLHTVSLAGTKLVSEEWTSKEKEEQIFVTDYIINSLKNTGLNNIKKNGPKTIDTGTVEHLKTTIKAELSGKPWLEIISSLHPTPAVCGIPTKEAKKFILNNENHSRSFYTGFIGIVANDVNCFVNLRCMQLQKNVAHLYLGGGLLKASEMKKEWEETERKAQTLAKYL